jgi:hypothetical protein
MIEQLVPADVTEEDVERAIALACRRSHAEVVAFTVAPRGAAGEGGAGHDWLVEFSAGPRCPVEVFRNALDAVDTGLSRLIELPAGTFDRWARERRAAGQPPGVPRLGADRSVAERLLDGVRDRCLVTAAPAAGAPLALARVTER